MFEGTVTLEVIWFTFWQAALSTLLTVVLALPMRIAAGGEDQ